MNNTIIKNLDLIEYETCYAAMRDFTLSRNEQTCDELWFAEHPAVYTQGLNGKVEHLLNTENIPVVQTDRGGQVTYHGPGQLLVYCLFDLKRKGLGVKALIHALEESIIAFLKSMDIYAERKSGAPGVYIKGEKISALGLRVKRGCSYHGLALNIDMDLSPYSGINPCGYAGLKITQLSQHDIHEDRQSVINKLLLFLNQYLKLSVMTETIKEEKMEETSSTVNNHEAA